MVQSWLWGSHVIKLGHSSKECNVQATIEESNCTKKETISIDVVSIP